MLSEEMKRGNYMTKSGIMPMLHGFIISALVVVVAITVEYFMGIV